MYMLYIHVHVCVHAINFTLVTPNVVNSCDHNTSCDYCYHSVNKFTYYTN